MGGRWCFLFLGLAVACPSVAAEAPAGTVRDYEVRLEEISKEVQDIRRELEGLVQAVVEGETGRLFVFLEGVTPELRERGASLTVDGKTVFSRPFNPSELDVLARGLPLELAELRVSAGEHRVKLGSLGGAEPETDVVRVARGAVSSWVAKPGPKGMEWRVE